MSENFGIVSKYSGSLVAYNVKNCFAAWNNIATQTLNPDHINKDITSETLTADRTFIRGKATNNNDHNYTVPKAQIISAV